MDFDEHVRRLVTERSEERRHTARGVCEDVGCEHEPCDERREVVCSVRFLRYAGCVHRRDEVAGEPDSGDEHGVGGRHEHSGSDGATEDRI